MTKSNREGFWPFSIDVFGMKKRVWRERMRKDSWFPLWFDIRNRFILVITCLAIMSLLWYRHLAVLTSDQGSAPSRESLQVDTPVLSRSGIVQNLVEDGTNERLRLGDPCQGRYVYIHSVPREFNAQLLEECRTLKDWSDMCVALSNAGLGQAMQDAEEYFTKTGWFETNQFALEVIFHNRMKQYNCLTTDARKAEAIFVPYYAGLEASRTLWDNNLTLRDATPLKFDEWVQSQPLWKAHSGHDHFMVGGRITWDFRRREEEWGNKLLKLPAMQNITSLVIEASPWDTNDVGIPYPTYFHPSSDSEIKAWQEKVKTFKRNVLFSFAGGSRERPGQIRGQLMDQCRRSQHGKLLGCDGGACQSPQSLMKLFEESVFCLQPQGDSATRRSIFDSMLAGCIPVFFHRDSYSEYNWHFPRNQTDFSVFISEDYVRSGVLSIESVLLRKPAKEIERMRNNIIGLIPDLVYADPRVAVLNNTRDAFDIAVEGVLRRFATRRLEEGVESDERARQRKILQLI